MSDQSVEQLAIEMMAAVAGIRGLASAHTEQLRNLQEACGGIAQLLQNHTAALQAHQRILQSLAEKTGITLSIDEPPNPPAGPVN